AGFSSAVLEEERLADAEPRAHSPGVFLKHVPQVSSGTSVAAGDQTASDEVVAGHEILPGRDRRGRMQSYRLPEPRVFRFPVETRLPVGLSVPLQSVLHVAIARADRLRLHAVGVQRLRYVREQSFLTKPKPQVAVLRVIEFAAIPTDLLVGGP